MQKQKLCFVLNGRSKQRTKLNQIYKIQFLFCTKNIAAIDCVIARQCQSHNIFV